MRGTPTLALRVPSRLAADPHWMKPAFVMAGEGQPCTSSLDFVRHSLLMVILLEGALTTEIASSLRSSQ